jgi:tryptophan synthase beta subunit
VGKTIPTGATVMITLSGRGDKDVAQVSELLSGVTPLRATSSDS